MLSLCFTAVDFIQAVIWQPENPHLIDEMLISLNNLRVFL